MLTLVLVMTGSYSVFAATSSNVIIVAETSTGGSITPPPEEEPDPPSIIIQDYPASMEVGESAKLSYSINNSDSNDVTWKSSDPDLLSIDADGKVTAIAAGTAKITVKCDSATDSVKITVKEVKAESIKITSDDFSLTDNVTGHNLKKGDTIKLQVEASPKEAKIDEVSWEVDDPEIAEIDSGGTLVALKNGKVKVTATSGDLSDEIEFQIGSSIPWVMIAIIAAIVIIIIVLIVLIVKSRRNRKPKSKRPQRYDDDEDDEDDIMDNEPVDDEAEAKRKQEELEREKARIRQEAYRQGFNDRDKEMTKVFDPKDFETKDDDDIE